MRNSRRKFIRNCGGVVGGSLIAGCLGSEEEDGPPGITTFRNQIAEELEVTITEAVERDGRVVLAYDSQTKTETEKWGYEVGFVSGRFARLVDDGWDVEGLTARTTGREGRTIQWELEETTARQFVNDEITADEFIEEIFASMTEQ